MNRQIVDNSDITVLILHDRLGTTTPRAESGTAEEARRFLASIRAGEDRRLLCFFKSSIDLKVSNLSELKRVEEFREYLGDEGVFYVMFETTAEFTSMVDVHLTKAVASYKAKAAISEYIDTAESDEVTDHELGVLDVAERLEDSWTSVRQLIGEYSKAVDQVNKAMNDGTDAAKALPENASIKARKLVVNQVTENMTQFSASGEGLNDKLLDIFSQNADDILAMVEFNVSRESPEDIAPLIDPLANMVETLSGTSAAMKNFRDVVASLPNLTAEMRKAKRKVVGTLSSLDSIINSYKARLVSVVAAHKAV